MGFYFTIKLGKKKKKKYQTLKRLFAQVPKLITLLFTLEKMGFIKVDFKKNINKANIKEAISKIMEQLKSMRNIGKNNNPSSNRQSSSSRDGDESNK